MIFYNDTVTPLEMNVNKNLSNINKILLNINNINNIKRALSENEKQRMLFYMSYCKTA